MNQINVNVRVAATSRSCRESARLGNGYPSFAPWRGTKVVESGTDQIESGESGEETSIVVVTLACGSTL
jgi:hypothetical protein